MIGKIIGIRIIKTPGSDDMAMITDGTESTTQGTTNAQFENKICEPTYDIGDLRASLDRMDANGSTNMAAAITLAHGHLGDIKYARAMVIATDGRPDRTQSALQAGQSAKNDGIDIITIGTDDADLTFLKKLSTSLDLGNKVPNAEFRKAIATAYLQLPEPEKIFQSNPLSRELGRRLQYSGY